MLLKAVINGTAPKVINQYLSKLDLQLNIFLMLPKFILYLNIYLLAL